MKVRHRVLALLCAVSVITFLDRLAIPVAESGIRADLQLSEKQWGWVLSAYVLANALFEIPSGSWGDRHGQRRELTRIAVWWSGFTAITGVCRGFWQVVSARFLFGVGAAGAYPNAAGVISRWFPKPEHARAQGFVWASSRLGGAMAPLLLTPLARWFGWRSIFWLLGLAGMLWATTWWAVFRDTPEQASGIPIGEILEINDGRPALPRGPTPWARMLRLRHLWLTVAAYFCYAWGSWFYYGWFTTWMVHGAGFSPAQMGVYASFPFLMGLVGNLTGGFLSERLVQRHGRRVTYRLITCGALMITSGLLYSLAVIHAHTALVVVATLGFGVMDLMLPAAWAMCLSLGGQFGGTATGIMNTAGNLGGWVCTVLFGYLVSATGRYSLPLQVIAGMVLLSALLFAGVDCTQGLQDDLRRSRSA